MLMRIKTNPGDAHPVSSVLQRLCSDLFPLAALEALLEPGLLLNEYPQSWESN